MTPKRGLEPGSQLGRYELLTPIAQGGMASVWAARQSGSHGFRKTVAMKTMLPALSEDPQFERMFLAEARLAMRMHHPNVVEILDLGEQEGLLYLVMEWIDGEPLSSLMKTVEASTGAPMARRIGAHICLKACLGLHAAHEVTDDEDRPVGIVHRDVSPQNIMVTYDGHVKVVDFGVAKSQSEGGMTATGQFKGKVPYMSPEQAESRAMDRRTDIFAMGTLLYRVTVGAHPFAGPNDLATLHNILHKPPAPIRDKAPDFPTELESIILRCLARDPNDRFSTMEELVSALESTSSSLGPPVSETELAALVKTTLGERRKERRGAMREAAKALGWAVATSESHPRVSLSLPNGSFAALQQTPSMLTPTGPSTNSALLLPGHDSVPTKTKGSGAPATKAGSRRIAISVMLGISAGAGVIAALILFGGQGPTPAPTTSSAQTAGAPSQTAIVTAIVTATAPPPVHTVDTMPSQSVTATVTHQPRPFAKPLKDRPTGTVRPKSTSPQNWGSGPDMGF